MTNLKAPKTIRNETKSSNKMTHSTIKLSQQFTSHILYQTTVIPSFMSIFFFTTGSPWINISHLISNLPLEDLILTLMLSLYFIDIYLILKSLQSNGTIFIITFRSDEKYFQIIDNLSR